MKEYLLHLMQYNRNADMQVIKLLTELNDLDMNLDRKSYYKSLQGLFVHIVGGALFLQKFVKASCPEISGLNHKYLDYQIEPGKDSSPSFSELKISLEILDNAFVEMVESLTDDDLKKTVSISLPQVNLEYQLGVLIMQYANHGTHHRGQISQILDEMGVNNDYSSIAPKYV